MSGQGAVSPKPGYRRTYDEEYEACVRSLRTSTANSHNETAESKVRDPVRLV
jgi:hypothetical protein